MIYRRQNQRGIALITTLIMLSVVTVMAVAFLAVSRRERSAVTTSSDRLDAKAMADIGLERAEGEVVARALARSNLLSYDLLVSTNFINPAGFVPGNTNIGNVNFVYANGNPVTGDDLLDLYRNLQVDPRVPVFITTNNLTGAQDFRYFLDFNRNGLVETNGIQPEVDNGGNFLGVTNYHVGDPDWIGVLRRPDQPHSGSNLFVGRYAYLILPAGKSLDLNFIHNQNKRLGFGIDGYFRNQGVGSWELNLAAFLRDLNTNAWNGYDYLTNLNTPSRLIAFDHALMLSGQRYRGNYGSLGSILSIYGLSGSRAFVKDYVDGYGDGPLQLDISLPYSPTTKEALDGDDATRPWFGAEMSGQYFDPQELFDIPGTGVFSFTNRLTQAGLSKSTYDRHTLYRMLGQLGTDSVPLSQNQINLNYDNRLDFDPRLAGRLPGDDVGYHATNFVRWTPNGFFTNAADQILKTLNPPPGKGVPLLSVTNIPVWPTNQYTPAVHRAFQLAANIYDATTNDTVYGYPFLPTSFRPVYRSSAKEVVIAGYEQLVGDDWLNKLWNTRRFDIDEAESRPQILKYDRVAGVPAIIGAKKGFPNFNEFELLTTVVASRKLELVKRSPTSPPAFTNQLYILGISNVFGVEFWNSYNQPYPRPLQLRARLGFELVLSNEFKAVRSIKGSIDYVTNIAALQWQGQQFRIPIHTNVLFLPMSAYQLFTGQFVPIRTNTLQTLFEPGVGFPVPVWRLAVTNRLEAALIDMSDPKGHLVDYVDLDNLNSLVDITREMFGQQNDTGQSSILGSFWRTNRVGGIPEGVMNQIQASLGSITVSQWNSASAEPTQGADKDKAIARFREFTGLAGQAVPPSPTLRMQVPFSPGIKLMHTKSWQVNDPLVNDLYSDLEDPSRTNQTRRLPPLFAPPPDWSNLGQINDRYSPWGKSQNNSSASTAFATETAVKDPLITKSDDWVFPTNTLPSIGWLGRIHRGTPWQTIYLKSRPIANQQWFLWSGHPDRIWPGNQIAPGTQPTNDWRLLDIFTTSVGENASRGLLSVNQNELAAWSAVFSGVPVLTNLATNVGPFIIEPNTFELRWMVDGMNAMRLQRQGQRFNYLGELLSTPELTDASPYLRLARGQNGTPPDAAVERIPQMVLSLLKRDEPRFVVYSYGQSLRPAPASVVTEPGPYFQMPTNYMITGEYVTKTRVHLEGFIENNQLRVRAVKESYNEVPAPE